MIDYQLDATETLEAGLLRDNLFEIMSGLKARSICGRRIAPMEVMICIEKVFLEIGNLKLKAPTYHHPSLVRVGLSGPMHTELIKHIATSQGAATTATP